MLINIFEFPKQNTTDRQIAPHTDMMDGVSLRPILIKTFDNEQIVIYIYILRSFNNVDALTIYKYYFKYITLIIYKYLYILDHVTCEIITNNS